MGVEVSDTTLFPYSAVVSIRATFPDGRVTLGTGALVGKNDVLTATHVIYQASYGGYATSIQVFPGADYNGLLGEMQSTPFGSYQSGSALAFPEEAFWDGDDSTTSRAEVSADIAIIGLTQAAGFQVGWFGLAPGNNTGMWTTEIGYPSDGTGMMQGPSYAFSNNGLWIEAYSYDGSTLLGSGSSGGPLVIQEDYLPSIIGVKSSGNSNVNYWADIDYKYEALITAINENDYLIGGSTFVKGTETKDFFLGSIFNQVIDGLSGMDTMAYTASLNQFSVFTTGNQQTNVVSKVGLNRGDTLTSIERLKFSDTSIALDIEPTENAGSVYMLYKAAFNRAPDNGGIGFWLNRIDHGLDIVTGIAQGFVDSAEFIAKYGANPTNASYVNSLYQNVLGRAGEAGGLAYWTGEMDVGRVSKAQVLVQFATLPEGAGIVAPLIANGIPYQEWLG